MKLLTVSENTAQQTGPNLTPSGHVKSKANNSCYIYTQLCSGTVKYTHEEICLVGYNAV
jgi:hypothetical protein